MTRTLYLTGASVAQKRKRVPGANHVKKNEVKIVNLADGAVPQDGISSMTLSSIYLSTASNRNYGAWYPVKLVWPNTGTGAGQRLGDKIFMKYIRIKGSIGVMNRVLCGIRWRLRLVRTENMGFTEGALNAINSYLEFFKATLSTSLSGTVQFIQEAKNAKHNFYFMYKNVEKRNLASTKVIASGYFPPSNYVREGVDIQSGSSGTVTHTLTIAPLLSSSYYSVPLDIKLKCNDWIDCSSVNYHLVLETDFPFGFSYNNLTEHGWGFSLSPDDTPFKANFFIIGYFTDP